MEILDYIFISAMDSIRTNLILSFFFKNKLILSRPAPYQARATPLINF
jgi:hypothetical protein